MNNDNGTTDNGTTRDSGTDGGSTGGEQFDARLLTGAYALDSLTESEASAFRRALGSSESLADETAELSETAALLGLATTPVEPSVRLKSELMAKLSLTPQLPAEPRAASEASADTGETVQTAPDAPAPVPLNTTPDSESDVLPTAVGESRAEQRAHVRWFARPVALVAGVAAAAALFIGGGFVGTAIMSGTGTSDVADSSATELARITAAPDVQRASVDVTGGGTATVVWSHELARSAVLAENLPELPDGKVYEAWYIDAKGPVAAGTFSAADSGTSWHVLEGSMTEGDIVGVTVEPAGGSQQPTTEPIFAVESA